MLFVPDLRMALLSASQLVRQQRHFVLRGNTMTLYAGTKPVIQGQLTGGVYALIVCLLVNRACLPRLLRP